MNACLISFNSRTRKGCDHVKFYFFLVFVVSIHAPVKGATFPAAQFNNHAAVSIHAPVKGATPYLDNMRIRTGGFNSRTRKGCDDLDQLMQRIERVSIHAPVKGATPGGVV